MRDYAELAKGCPQDGGDPIVGLNDYGNTPVRWVKLETSKGMFDVLWLQEWTKPDELQQICMSARSQTGHIFRLTIYPGPSDVQHKTLDGLHAERLREAIDAAPGPKA